MKNLEYKPILVILPLYFESQFLRMVRVVIRGWLSCAICNIEPWLSFSVFCFLQTLLLDRLLSRVSYVLIFVIRKNEIFISVIRTWSSIIFFPFVNRDRVDPAVLPSRVDSSVPLTHHVPRDIRLIWLVKKRKIHFRILSDLIIQSWIFLKKGTLN